MAEQESVTFLASFPAIQSAIKVDGSGGMRIQLDIPESEMGRAIKLMLYRQIVIQVTVKPYVQENPTTDNRNGDRTPKRSAAKRRV